jgi:hypothetical protein
LTIPIADVASWASTVPTVSLTTDVEDVRQVRVRFYPNPYQVVVDEADDLSSDFCGEFLLSYLPANSVLTVNGVSHTAYAVVAGAAPIPADQLLYGTDGDPMDWAELSCGIAYVMTVDILPTADIDNLTIGLVLNRKE